MVANQAVARRYADALFSLAQEKNQVDAVEADLALIASAIRDSRELRALVENQDYSPSTKLSLLKKIFDGKVSPLTQNFIGVVVTKRREAFFPSIYASFVELANQARGVVEVEVRSAAPLGDEQISALEGKLGARLGKRLRLTTRVDESLIGGLVVKVGDTLMDGSVRTRLGRLRERLLKQSSV